MQPFGVMARGQSWGATKLITCCYKQTLSTVEQLVLKKSTPPSKDPKRCFLLLRSPNPGQGRDPMDMLRIAIEDGSQP